MRGGRTGSKIILKIICRYSCENALTEFGTVLLWNNVCLRMIILRFTNVLPKINIFQLYVFVAFHIHEYNFVNANDIAITTNPIK